MSQDSQNQKDYFKQFADFLQVRGCWTH